MWKTGAVATVRFRPILCDPFLRPPVFRVPSALPERRSRGR